MTLDDFIPRFVNFAMFLANAIVCSAATRFYLRRARRSVLFIAISSGLGVVMTVVSWMSEVDIWRLASFISIIDLALWTIGCCLLFRELAQDDDRVAEPAAAPNGGPATRLGNSTVTEGPPSVS